MIEASIALALTMSPSERSQFVNILRQAGHPDIADEVDGLVIIRLDEEMHYWELKLADGKVVRWPGATGEEAASRYMEVCGGPEVVDVREAQHAGF